MHYYPNAAYFVGASPTTPELLGCTLTPSDLMSAIGMIKEILQADIEDPAGANIKNYFFGVSTPAKTLFSHPLANLIVPRARERFIHPAVTDACFYALRNKLNLSNEMPGGGPGTQDDEKDRFCLVGRGCPPGFDNNMSDDWMTGIIALIHYGLPDLVIHNLEHVCVSNDCMDCNLNFVFENIWNSLDQGLGQPINIRMLVERFKPETPYLPEMEVMVKRVAPVYRGILSCRLYKHSSSLNRPILRRAAKSAQLEVSVLEPFESQLRERTRNTFKIRFQDQEYSSIIETYRPELHNRIMMHLTKLIRLITLRERLSTPYSSIELMMNAEIRKTENCSATNKNILKTLKPLVFNLNFSEYMPLNRELPDAITNLAKRLVFRSFEDSMNDHGNFEVAVDKGVTTDNFSGDAPPIRFHAPVKFPFSTGIIEKEGGAQEPKAANSAESTERYAQPLMFLEDSTSRLKPNVSFAKLLQNTFNESLSMTMRCSRCSSPGLHTITSKVVQLPDYLCIRADNLKYSSYWRGPDDLETLISAYLKANANPLEVPRDLVTDIQQRIVDNANFSVLPELLYIAPDGSSVSEDYSENMVQYELVAVLVTVNGAWNSKIRGLLEKIWLMDNYAAAPDVLQLLRGAEIEESMLERPTVEDQLLTYVKINKGYVDQTPSSENMWVGFNGPTTFKISSLEVRNFSRPYKYPLAFVYSCKPPATSRAPCHLAAGGIIKFCRVPPLNCQEVRMKKFFTPFSKTEAMELTNKAQMACGMDSEYVVKSYTNKAIGHIFGEHPQYSVARLSIVRASTVGNLRPGEPFYDAHVRFWEHPYEYRTEFSGIEPGSLHSTTSQKWLVDFIDVYNVIRCLAKYNMRFIGHDLLNDFRALGIIIPMSQIIDTVVIYRQNPSSRFLSLKFLAWAILSKDIQQKVHDSVEDAETCVELYKFYEQFRASPTRELWNSVFLAGIYDFGKIHRYKAPFSNAITNVVN